MDITGNTILIPGGASGLGLSLAKAFLTAQNTVIICDLNHDLIEKEKRDNIGLHGIVCDLRDSTQRTKLFENVINDFPDINILINNAGVCPESDFSKPVSAGQIQAEIETNFVTPVDLIRLFLPTFFTRKYAAIINICSECGIRPFYPIPLYTGTKAGLTFFSEALRHRLRHQISDMPILISEVYPPTLDTPMNAHRKDIRKVHPDSVAKQTLRGIQKNRSIIWTKFGEVRLLHFLNRWLIRFFRFPRKLARSARRIMRGEKIAW